MSVFHRQAISRLRAVVANESFAAPLLAVASAKTYSERMLQRLLASTSTKFFSDR
jgi:hypothetical protein